MAENSSLSQPRIQEFDEEEIIRQAPHRKFNWTLFFGVLILLGISLFAIFGPQIAPRDPLEENFIIKIGDKWEVPPFRIFTEGFPLGSDEFGRDLWSRLLWGIRPTLIMVVIVGVIRLFLGVLIGLFAGWSDGRLGRFLDSLIEGAVSIPVFFVALGAIALIGPEYGLWAFIIGLSLTGWVETSQQVREQTRIIKKQTYIEAARAIGSTRNQILGGHIIRQIMPMVLMLFAFEMSSTLMLTAGLGFLGYYIGGDVWIASVEDFVSRRISGMPELGQMLATSWAILTQPWGMVAVGTTIFVTVLGFNLVGEGLRASLNVNVIRKRSIVTKLRERTSFWLEDHIYYPLGQFFARPLIRIILYGGLLAAFVWFGGVQFLFPKIQNWMEHVGSQGAALAVAVETPNPENQVASPTSPPEQAETNSQTIVPTILQEIDSPEGFGTGLAYSPNEQRFYVATQSGILLAYDMNGNIVWELQLPEIPFDAIPIVSQDGTIFIADRKAGISAVSSNGELIWHFITDVAPNTVSAPILSSDGILYYVVSNFTVGYIQAVSTSGEGLWNTIGETTNFYYQLSISLDGKFLFLREDAIDTETQEHLKIETNFTFQRVIGGLDGNNYLLAGQNLIRVDFTKTPPELLESTSWDSHDVNINPQNTPGYIMVEPKGEIRIMYTTPGGSSYTIWQQVEGQIQGEASVRLSGSFLQAINANSNMLLCGGRAFQSEFLSCALMKKDLEVEAWKIELGRNGPALGGFVLDDKYYFSTASGKIYVIKEELISNGQETAQQTPPPNQGILWSFPYGNAVDYGPQISTDGTIFLIDDENVLTTINPDGTERYQGTIPKPWLQYVDAHSNSNEIYPFLIQDRLVIVAEDNTVYALDADGEVQWEYSLENPLKHYPTTTPELIYIIDSQGVLHVFSHEGLLWSFTPDGPNIPTGSLAIGPDGSVYYGLTNLGKGFIQALTSTGQPLWNIQANTDFFYDPLEIAGDGKYVFLNDDIYRLDTGELVDAVFPFPVDDLLAGADGKFYVRSGASILQWQLGGDGVEILHTASLERFTTSPFFPFVRISDQSILWVYKFSGSLFGVTWMDGDGNVIGEFFQKQGEFLYEIQENPIKIGVCTQSEEALSCGSVDPVTQKYSEFARVAGVSKFLPSNLSSNGDGYLYVLTNGRDLLKIYIGN